MGRKRRSAMRLADRGGRGGGGVQAFCSAPWMFDCLNWSAVVSYVRSFERSSPCAAIWMGSASGQTEELNTGKSSRE